jgi:hypothetical protein
MLATASATPPVAAAAARVFVTVARASASSSAAFYGPQRDLVGPPDRLSNLRPVRVAVPPEGESALRRKWRLAREDNLHWCHQFWAQHNQQFNQVCLSWFSVQLSC